MQVVISAYAHSLIIWFGYKLACNWQYLFKVLETVPLFTFYSSESTRTK